MPSMGASVRAWAQAWAAVAALLPVASATFTMHNPLVIGQTFMANSQDPTDGSTGWALTSHGIAEKLFTVDKMGNVVPQVAESVTKIDTMMWEVLLKANYKFSDGTVVTAQHVADALQELNTQNSRARSSLGTMTMTVVDSRRLRIQSTQATPVMDAVLAEFIFTVYRKDGNNWIFTGPFVVETFTAGTDIKLIPNTHYVQHELRPLVTIKKYATGNDLADALQSGTLDMAFHLPVDRLSALRSVSGVSIRSFEVEYHYMMFHNMRRAPLNDLKVRQAVDLAIDRVALTQELRGGQATQSFFPEDTPWGLTGTRTHGDQSAAEALLDQAGWLMDAASGNRMKNGATLTCTLVAYPQRPGLVLMQPLINDTLNALGFEVTTIVTDGANWNELDQIMADDSYDLLMWAQNTLPAGDPQFFLNDFFRTGAGSNHAGIGNTTIDGLLDDLAVAPHSTRVSAAEAAHRAILEQVPASNLMTPSWHVGFSDRLPDYEPWGSDYYVVKAALGLPPVITTTTGNMEVSSARPWHLLLTAFLVPSLAFLFADL